jgi:hypothetical protein
MNTEQTLRQWIEELRDDAASYGKEDGKVTKGYVWAGAIYQECLRILNETAEPARPTVVCLCGSTRFWRAFQQAGLAETMAGRIVLSIGAASGTDDEHFGNLPRAEYDRVKTMLDELHMRKIDMADEVLILNVDGYVGESTSRELAYARKLGKVVRFLEPER